MLQELNGVRVKRGGGVGRRRAGQVRRMYATRELYAYKDWRQHRPLYILWCDVIMTSCLWCDVIMASCITTLANYNIQ